MDRTVRAALLRASFGTNHSSRELGSGLLKRLGGQCLLSSLEQARPRARGSSPSVAASRLRPHSNFRWLRAATTFLGRLSFQRLNHKSRCLDRLEWGLESKTQHCPATPGCPWGSRWKLRGQRAATSCSERPPTCPAWVQHPASHRDSRLQTRSSPSRSPTWSEFEHAVAEMHQRRRSGDCAGLLFPLGRRSNRRQHMR